MKKKEKCRPRIVEMVYVVLIAREYTSKLLHGIYCAADLTMVIRKHSHGRYKFNDVRGINGQSRTHSIRKQVTRAYS